MKTIQYTLLVLLACITFSGCQEVEDPVNNVPTVTTDVVEKFSSEFAYISGTVSSRAECYFLVSTSEDLADARQVKAYGTVPKLSAEVGDLKPGTTYYCALCATDGRSVVKGNVQSFKTNSYLSIGSVEPSSEIKSDIIGTYVTNEKQEIFNFRYGNMETVRATPNWTLPFGVLLTDTPYTVYAYSPYHEGTTRESLNGVNVWTRGTNDYLYGKSEVVNSNKPSANIIMHSALAHLSFSISTDNESITIASINLRNAHSTPEVLSIHGNMNIVTGTITPVAAPGHDGIIVAPSNFVVKKGTDKNIEMQVIPTSFTAGEVILMAYVGTQRIYVPLPVAATWEKGKNYEIAVKINAKEKMAEVGDFYYSDGTWSSERIASKSCVGIVFALSKESGGDIDAILSSSKHGRIVALKDVGTHHWGTSAQVTDALTFSGLDGSGADYGYLPIDGKDKYSDEAPYCRIPYNYENWLVWSGANYKDYALCNYDGASFSRGLVNGGNAASLCNSYEEGGLSWFLPSVGEMARLSLACGYDKISMNKQLGFIGLKGKYWTSCAVFASMAWGFTSDTCLFTWYDLPEKLNVRPIAAF